MTAVDIGADTVVALRDSASVHLDGFLGLLDLGALAGLAPPTPLEVREPLQRLDDLSIDGLRADAEALGVAYRTVIDQLHALPGQTASVAAGWLGKAGEAALGVVVDHQDRVGADLAALRTMAMASGAAAAGVDRIVRTTYRSIATIAAPVIAGVPVEEVPAALVTGSLPPGAVADDIASRLRLYFAVTAAAIGSVNEILGLLTAAAEQSAPPASPSANQELAATAPGSGNAPPRGDATTTRGMGSSEPMPQSPARTLTEVPPRDADPVGGPPPIIFDGSSSLEPSSGPPANSPESAPGPESEGHSGSDEHTGPSTLRSGQGNPDGASAVPNGDVPDVPLRLFEPQVVPQQESSQQSAQHDLPESSPESTADGDLALAGDE